MNTADYPSQKGSWLAALPGILAVATTYVYFLLFAQFGFLGLLQRHGATVPEVERVMAAMGLAGLVASLLTGYLLASLVVCLGRDRPLDPRMLLRAAFAAAAVTALAAVRCRDIVAFQAVAALIGLSVGSLTVTLAASLRQLLPGRRFGLQVGIGTGLAYAVCNLPPLFAADPRRQAAAAAVAALLGLAASLARHAPVEEPDTALANRPALTRDDFRRWGFVSLLLSFLALIWLDSAAFVIIQETTHLKDLTWGSSIQTLLLGAIHLVAAIAAGWLIDRGWFRSLLVAAFVGFAIACTVLDQAAATFAGPLYTVAVSLYSVALVVYPASWRDEEGLLPRRWRAALVYGVCGWVGSALGIGMAQNLHTVPPLFLVITGLLLAIGWLLTHGQSASSGRAFSVTWMCGVVALALYSWPPASDATATAAARGRRVYIAEGCIHCHSQYVRPATHDTEMWGPARIDFRQETPPLLGNRRQGPDLRYVGARRSAAWHRLHLLDPRSVSPGSRMPSYAHLFAAGSSRGEDLVAYLAALGSAATDTWYEHTRATDVSEAAYGGRAQRGRQIFQSYCAPCHGQHGRGDGPLAQTLYRPAMDLQKGSFWLLSWGPGAEPEAEALARAIKYGVAGTSMPGHEYLDDRQIADVVAFVRQLRAASPAASDGDLPV